MIDYGKENKSQPTNKVLAEYRETLEYSALQVGGRVTPTDWRLTAFMLCLKQNPPLITM